MDIQLCKNCTTSYDKDVVARVLGKESSVYDLNFCSVQCYTEYMTKEAPTVIPGLENIAEGLIGDKTFVATNVDKGDDYITLSTQRTCYHVDLSETDFQNYIEISEQTTLPVNKMFCGDPFIGDEKIDYITWRDEHVNDKDFAEAVLEYFSKHKVKTALDLIYRSEQEAVKDL